MKPPSPYYDDSQVKLYLGDCIEVMNSMPEQSIHCAVTSPPYWGLRDYEAEGQIGLEASLDDYVAKLVEVFRAVRRVLRDDGTLWLNIGDGYAGSGKGPGKNLNGPHHNMEGKHSKIVPNGLKPKDMLGIPWRVVEALQADGWWKRSEIIWFKTNPLPESVDGTHFYRHRIKREDLPEEKEDCPGCPKCEKYGGFIYRQGAGRPTKSHEYVFLLSKSASYFYDQEAIREPGEGYGRSERFRGDKYTNNSSFQNSADIPDSKGGGRALKDGSGRNKRTVWAIATEAYGGPHYATFPQALVRPCVQAGTSEWGCCAKCGVPYARVIEKQTAYEGGRRHDDLKKRGLTVGTGWKGGAEASPQIKHIGWRKPCAHIADVAPCVVLDPFVGTGTACKVARDLGRHGVGIDISEDYMRLAVNRIGQQLSLV